MFCFLLFARAIQAADVEECRKLWLHGDYDQCIKQAAEGLKGKADIETFAELKGQSEFIKGKYLDAFVTVRGAVGKSPQSIRLRWLAIQYAPFSGKKHDVKPLSDEVDILVKNAAWRYSQDPENLVTLAEFVLSQGGDAKQVQTVLLKRARQLSPDSRFPLLAIGNLALDKRDFALAAETFRDGLKKFPKDPEFTFGLAEALESDPREMRGYLELTLHHNRRHIGALLLQAEQFIDGEQYDEAIAKLKEVRDVNKQQPVALSSLSIISAIQGDQKKADEYRQQALSTWKENPEVDYTIGRKLSQKYRFDDGAAAQRRSLAFNSEYLPAKKQLALDLLRLGKDDEGWKRAQEAYAQDQYDIASYNLVTLQDELEKFTVIEQPGWRIRMEKQEAAIYGDRVVALLNEAREKLCPRYELELTDTISVEIFPKPADFAVRTFGMPGAGAYLGVCFGDVITARSPASQTASPVNWESVLWHEFAHVVTLNKTHNRMPRWLSEGISVYEERQRDPRWGERMSPAYRELILADRLVPINRMSEAFLSSRNLMFAYYQSSLVVEFIEQTYGHAALVAILHDLGAGIPINDAIERHTMSMGELNENFVKAAKMQATFYGWYVDWSPLKLDMLLQGKDKVGNLLAWAKQHPRHYQGLKTIAQMLKRLDRHAEAAVVLQQAAELFPFEAGDDSALAQLAQLQHEQRLTDDEYLTLTRWASIDDDASSALLRLIEIDTQRGNWPLVQQHARRLREVKPLIPQPYNAMAQSAEHQKNPKQAEPALRALLRLAPSDGADIHHRLAVQLRELKRSDEARRQVLQALERAPRYREALSLLLTLDSSGAEKRPSESGTGF
ncbi:tetratricopeptide repeat protein [Planctomicrobium piriforme]|nr:tetratricopeptide repeat protein [Planctomicrobium piriforme]